MLQCGPNLKKYWIPAFTRKTTSKKRGYDKHSPHRTRPPPSSPRRPRHPRAAPDTHAPPPSSSRTRGSMLQCGTNLKKYWIPAFARKTSNKKRGYDKHSPRRTRPPPRYPRHPRAAPGHPRAAPDTHAPLPTPTRRSRHPRAAPDTHAPLPTLTRRRRHPRERGDPCSSVSPTFENTGSPHSRGRRPAKNVGTTSIPRAAPGHPRVTLVIPAPHPATPALPSSSPRRTRPPPRYPRHPRAAPGHPRVTLVIPAPHPATPAPPPSSPRHPRNPAIHAPPPPSPRTRGPMLQCGPNLKKYWIPAFTRKTTSKKRGYDKYSPRRSRPPPQSTQSRHPRATPVILANAGIHAPACHQPSKILDPRIREEGDKKKTWVRQVLPSVKIDVESIPKPSRSKKRHGT